MKSCLLIQNKGLARLSEASYRAQLNQMDGTPQSLGILIILDTVEGCY